MTAIPVISDTLALAIVTAIPPTILALGNLVVACKTHAQTMANTEGIESLKTEKNKV